jgi:hypothetical protein
MNEPLYSTTSPHRTPVNNTVSLHGTGEPLYKRPSRKRLARLTSEQIRQAVADQNVDLLNEQRKLSRYQFTHITVDVNGLCLNAPATLQTNKSGLCE